MPSEGLDVCSTLSVMKASLPTPALSGSGSGYHLSLALVSLPL